jgi:6-phosphofructokinase
MIKNKKSLVFGNYSGYNPLLNGHTTYVYRDTNNNTLCYYFNTGGIMTGTT